MPDEHGGPPLEFQADLAIWSLLAFLVAMGAIAVVAVCWYRHKPTLPIAVLFIATIIGLFTWPLLAIVSAVLLAGLIVSTTLRNTSLATHSKNDDQPSQSQLPTPHQQTRNES